MKRSLVVLLAVLVTGRLNAATFRVQYQGKQLAGSEICLFDARSLDDPLERLTTFTTVRCVSADADVPLPKGTWNLFARNKEGYVSSRILIVSNGRVEGDQRDIDLERAGRVRLGFAPEKSESLAIYVERSGLVLPFVPGENEILVPAATALFPFVIEGGSANRIGGETSVDAAKVATISNPPLAEGKRDFAIGVVPDRDAFRKIPIGQRAAGRIELESGDAKPLSTVNRVDAAFKGQEALALFRQVPVNRGAGVVRVVGQGWSGSGGTLKSFRTEGPLRIAPTTSLTVRWSVLDDVVSLVEQFRDAPKCKRRESAAEVSPDVPGVASSGLTLTLARCPGLQAATPEISVRKSSCAQVAAATLDQSRMSGSATMNDIAPGVYLLRLGYGTLPPAFAIVDVARHDASATIALRYDRWFGRVTREGKPLFAQVGIGAGAVSNAETGEYFAVSIPIALPPPTVAARMFKDPPPIAIAACDSDVEVLFTPDEQPVANSRFDIEIHPNRVLVRAIDDRTSKPVPEAAIEYGVMRRDYPDEALLGGVIGKTDEKGEFKVNDVPQNREIEVCASRDDYRRKCASRFAMKDDREREVSIALQMIKVLEGRVVHPGVGGGRVIWYGLDGRSLESVEIAADGTFTYKNPHVAGEVVSVVSAGAPLLVLRQPPLRDEETFEIQFPAAPVRSFNVSLLPDAREAKGFVSMAIGDIVVPLGVLSQHLRPRGIRPLFLSPGEIQVRDIVANGRVSFIFLPLSFAETYGKDRSVDFFYLPAASALPRVKAGDGTNVIVGGD